MEKFKTASLAALLMLSLAGCEGETASLDGEEEGSNSAPSPQLQGDVIFVDNFLSAQGIIFPNDADSDDTHTYNVEVDPALGLASVSSTTGVLNYFASSTESDYTDFVVVEVTDSEGNSGSVTAVVYVGNITPVLSSEGSLTVDAGSSVQSSIAVSDVNVDDTHTYDITSGPLLNAATADVAAGSGNTATLTYSAGAAGVDQVVVRVTDSEGASSTLTIGITVNSVEDPNQAPAPTASPSSFSVETGEQQLLLVNANDPDATDTHTYAVTSAASFGAASVGSTSGIVTYVAGDVAGSESFDVTVTDNHGAEATVTVTGTVSAPVVEEPTGNAENGEAVAAANGCTASFCHGSDFSLNQNNILNGATASAIANAVENVSAMSFLDGALTEQDREDLAAYINTF